MTTNKDDLQYALKMERQTVYNLLWRLECVEKERDHWQREYARVLRHQVKWKDTWA